MAKFCEKCGTPMEDEAVFCPNCGAAAAPAVEKPATVVEEPSPVAEEPAPAPAVEEPAAETAPEPAPVAEEPAPEPVAEEPAPAVETAAAQEQSGFTYAGATQAPKQEAAPQDPQYRYQPAPQAQPVYQQAQPVYQQPVYAPAPNAADAEDQTVSTARFFWFRVLFAIPLVGFILSIVMSFAPKNKSFKHFARSYMIMNFIAIGIVLVICIVIMATGGTLAGLYYDILHSM